MITVDILKATASLAEYARKAGDQVVVVTSRGKPVAAVVDVKGVDQETLSLSTNPKFLAIIERSRARRAEGWISSEEMRRRLGLKPKARKRRPAAAARRGKGKSRAPQS